jgi:hypothetical protein
MTVSPTPVCKCGQNCRYPWNCDKKPVSPTPDERPDKWIKVEGDKPKVAATERYFAELRASLKNALDVERSLRESLAEAERRLVEAERERDEALSERDDAQAQLLGYAQGDAARRQQLAEAEAMARFLRVHDHYKGRHIDRLTAALRCDCGHSLDVHQRPGPCRVESCSCDGWQQRGTTDGRNTRPSPKVSSSSGGGESGERRPGQEQDLGGTV